MPNPITCECEKDAFASGSGLVIKYEEDHTPAAKKAFNTLYIDSKNVKQYIYDSYGNYTELYGGGTGAGSIVTWRTW